MVAIVGNKFRIKQSVRVHGREGIWKIVSTHPTYCVVKRIDGKSVEKHSNSAIYPYVPPKVESEQPIGRRPTFDPIFLNSVAFFFGTEYHKPLSLDSPLWDKDKLLLIPPFQEVSRWVKKIESVNAIGITVTPNWTESSWFQQLGDCPVCFLGDSPFLVILFNGNNHKGLFKNCFQKYGRVH